MKRRPVMILGRICWVGVVLLAGLAATGLQMDRQARKDSVMAQIVPSAFRGYALETLARKAYADNEPAQGLSYSRDLVLRRPVPAENLSLLTKGLLAAGKNDEALPPLLLSAERGWRDRYTQRLMVASALQVDDAEVAAQRLLALWRLGERDAQIMALTNSLLSEQDGLVRFTQGIVKSDRWGTRLLAWGADNLPTGSVEAIAAALANKGVEIDCKQLSGVVRRLAQTGDARSAINLWSTLCGNGAATPPDDFGFKILSGEAGPFDWNFPDQAALAVELVTDGNRVSLDYDYAEQIRVVMAKRNAVLAPSDHTARIDAEGRAHTDVRPIMLQITCFSDKGASTRRDRVPLSRHVTAFAIPATGCVSQELALITAHGSGRVQGLTIDPK